MKDQQQEGSTNNSQEEHVEALEGQKAVEKIKSLRIRQKAVSFVQILKPVYPCLFGLWLYKR